MIYEIFYLHQKSLDCLIIIEQLRYRPIGLCSNIIYGLLIVDWSYEYQRQNINNIVQYFNISVISCTVSIVNWSIHRTKPSFFLHSISLYVDDRTIDQPKYYIIIYTI